MSRPDSDSSHSTPCSSRSPSSNSIRRPSQSPSISILLNNNDTHGHDDDPTTLSRPSSAHDYFSVEPSAPEAEQTAQTMTNEPAAAATTTTTRKRRRHASITSYDGQPGFDEQSRRSTSPLSSSMPPPPGTRSSTTPNAPHSHSLPPPPPPPPPPASAPVHPPTSSEGGGNPASTTSSPKRPSSSSSSRPSSSAGLPPPPPPPPAPVPSSSPRIGGTRPIEPSLFNVEPIDEFTKEVADWLWGFCQGLDWNVVEIEAKIGILVDMRVKGDQRFSLMTPIEHIIMDDSGTRFVSNMTLNQHKSYNQLLNSRVEETALPSYASSPVRYHHTRERDSFHPAPQGGMAKVRVTTDGKDPSKVLRVVEKSRLADMNVASPKRCFDWRISVSTEVPATAPASPVTLTRFKDRISYSHQLFRVDLTQVTQPNKPTLHELEIEFVDAKALLIEAEKEGRGEESRYLDMVQAFLNNIRMLIRNAGDP